MLFIDQVKQWFRTNLKPTEGQFWSWLNWVRWKDEAIGISEVTDLQNQLNALGQPIQKFEATGYWEYIIPLEYIVEWLLIKPSTDCIIAYGIDGDEIDNDVAIESYKGGALEGLKPAFFDRTLYVDGLPPKTIIYIKRYKLP